MRTFRWIEDVEAWLKPMDYETFWRETAPYGLKLQRRGHCDRQIAQGVVDAETVIIVLKGMVRDQLRRRHALDFSPRRAFGLIRGGGE